MREIFIEAESFQEKGGWIVEQQSMETLGSAYLMAHGMGIPVRDAKHTLTVEEDGLYNVWVRTRDWTAVWNVKDSAGTFQLLINGECLPVILGTNGEEWSWQKAGAIELGKGQYELSLHDLTGFNGRVDAIYFTTNEGIPSEDISRMRQRLNWKEIVDQDEEYDLIVVGGGVAGTCLALSAIRAGCKTLLLHDRGVLGGCNSSEIRVCMGGEIKYPPLYEYGTRRKGNCARNGLSQAF